MGQATGLGYVSAEHKPRPGERKRRGVFEGAPRPRSPNRRDGTRSCVCRADCLSGPRKSRTGGAAAGEAGDADHRIQELAGGFGISSTLRKASTLPRRMMALWRRGACLLCRSCARSAVLEACPAGTPKRSAGWRRLFPEAETIAAALVAGLSLAGGYLWPGGLSGRPWN